jgi:cytochrome c oxidase subunit III
MAQESTARKLDPLPLAADAKVDAKIVKHGGREPPVRHGRPLGSNRWLGVVMFLGAEAMFFAGLMGAYLVFRVGAAAWPPPFQPRLPIGITGVNTVILLVSALTMARALKAVRANDRRKLAGWLGLTALLGAIFLMIQGYEWAQLIGFGLTVSSSVYGGLFYLLIGFHALHVLGALVWLLVVLWFARNGSYSPTSHVGVQTCGLYWTFVVALWPVLYGLVYLY